MRRIPSIDTIEATGCDRQTAIKIRRVLDGRDEPELYEQVQADIRRSYSEPRRYHKVLTACDELLGTCGTEAIRSPTAWREYFCDTVAIYCNTGDSYAATILYDVERDVFYVSSWADWVESAERNGRYKFQ